MQDNLCTTNDIRGCAAVPTVRRLLGLMFPIATERRGQGARVAPNSSRSKDPVVLAGAPGDPLLPWGFSGILLGKRPCRLWGYSEYYGPTAVQEERRAGGPTRE